jgi:hypothetical protein
LAEVMDPDHYKEIDLHVQWRCGGVCMEPSGMSIGIVTPVERAEVQTSQDEGLSLITR